MKLRAFLLVVGGLAMLAVLVGCVWVWRFDEEEFAESAIVEWLTDKTEDERFARAEGLRRRFHQGGGRCMRHYRGVPTLSPAELEPFAQEIAPLLAKLPGVNLMHIGALFNAWHERHRAVATSWGVAAVMLLGGP